MNMLTPTLAFGIPSGPDLLVIAAIILLLFGAKKLPGLARATAQSLGAFRLGKMEIEKEIAEAQTEFVAAKKTVVNAAKEAGIKLDS